MRSEKYWLMRLEELSQGFARAVWIFYRTVTMELVMMLCWLFMTCRWLKLSL
jgi:hypothetical protein